MQAGDKITLEAGNVWVRPRSQYDDGYDECKFELILKPKGESCWEDGAYKLMENVGLDIVLPDSFDPMTQIVEALEAEKVRTEETHKWTMERLSAKIANFLALPAPTEGE